MRSKPHGSRTLGQVDKVGHLPELRFALGEPEVDTTEELAEWTKHRGDSPRLYPGALVWAIKKPGRDLRAKVELWLAWKRVALEVAEGILGGDFDPADRAELKTKEADAEEAAREEVWGDYRYVVFADDKETDGLAVIDLGKACAGASSPRSRSAPCSTNRWARATSSATGRRRSRNQASGRWRVCGRVFSTAR